ncbi:hypothetical protein [uncultured Helicobacter sp.]|uniref:hypothetical protein n=1 Tax=uncultured Helicobacter sp. TaxID=175537 RepID=UPI00259460C5|nr:hypothetical protein [uncultured Helicobacter sp.]
MSRFFTTKEGKHATQSTKTQGVFKTSAKIASFSLLASLLILAEASAQDSKCASHAANTKGASMPQNSPNSLFDTQDFHALTQSDPEFIANMRYFVESEVAQASSHIDSPKRAKISLAATLGAQSTSLFSALLDSMLIAESSQKDAQKYATHHPHRNKRDNLPSHALHRASKKPRVS